MKKDIKFNKVENLAVAVIPEPSGEGNTGWGVYLINLENRKLETVLVTSKGYSAGDEKEDETVKTSTLRQLLGDIEGIQSIKIESIIPEVFKLVNEYWISFWLNGDMYDKKYVFVRESIRKDYFTMVPVINQKGVMIL